MLSSGYIPVLSNLMFMNALLAAGCLKGYYTAWLARETDAIASFESTQRMRYFVLMSSQAILLVLGITMLSYGLDAVQINTNQWADAGLFGYVVWGLTVFTLSSPIITAVVALHIYRKPSRLAKRVKRTSSYGKKYVTTVSVRKGCPVVVRVEVTPGLGGLHKNYVPVLV